MNLALRRSIGIVAGMAALLGAAAAHASVQDGVQAWDRGDWAAAVADWQGPAEAGDPDAMFNLGQAYRLGRGVQQDRAKALDYYQRAAKLGHVRAADTYGILLFQEGKRKQAMPYIEASARRGDPRAEYLLGIALFNGDMLAKDWVRAYALLTLANSAGLPQAASTLAEMNKYISLEQRQQAAGLAVKLKSKADATRARQFAAADLGTNTPPAPALPALAQQGAGQRSPQPIHSVDVEPSVAAAQEAVREAMVATGKDSPAEAGADYARPATPQQVAVNQPPPPAPPPPARTNPPPPAPRRVLQPPPAATGVWKVQLGVFSVRGNAERLWAQLSGRPELAKTTRLLVRVGGLTKLLAGGYSSQGAAAAACQGLKRAGQDCLVAK